VNKQLGSAGQLKIVKLNSFLLACYFACFSPITFACGFYSATGGYEEPNGHKENIELLQNIREGAEFLLRQIPRLNPAEEVWLNTEQSSGVINRIIAANETTISARSFSIEQLENFILKMQMTENWERRLMIHPDQKAAALANQIGVLHAGNQVNLGTMLGSFLAELHAQGIITKLNRPRDPCGFSAFVISSMMGRKIDELTKLLNADAGLFK